MISHIRIKDFAVIENTAIDFFDGLNIITGETGAGKSIVIEAIHLALGGRASAAYVRAGKEKAVIQLVAEQDGEERLITREISAAGKSLCKINDDIVTLAQLGLSCKQIADIHGQYDHQSLLHPENHIQLLDSYNKADMVVLKEDVLSAYTHYTEIKNKLSRLLSDYEENLRQRDFARYELDEINKAKLFPGEDAELADTISLLQNSEKIVHNLSGAYAIAYEESPAALDGLKKALDLLQEISAYTPHLSDTANAFADAYYKLDDLRRAIRNSRDGTSFSQQELDDALSRLSCIDGLKRKHGGSIEKVLQRAETLAEQLAAIENIDGLKADLTAQLAAAEERLQHASAALSQLRKQNAKALEEKILEELKELHFKDACLSIDFTAESGYTANGTDRVEFLISANKGEPLKPLAKIASGGEMSRIMLAFKKIIADYDDIPTMIFDEIDSGISGIAASVVGQKLRQIAEKRQIICITHLPQIAAFGLHNYRIQKDSDDRMTYTTVVKLSKDEKIAEIARLLGGLNITDKTQESARELVELSIAPPNKPCV